MIFKKILSTLGILTLAAFFLVSTVSADSNLSWTGQGTSNGQLNTVQCSGDTANPGQLLWIFTGGPNVTSATLTVNGTTYTGTQQGGSFHFVTGWYTLDPAVTNASVSWTGNTTGNPQLTISHGCPPLASVTFTKTFEQSSVALPANGDACFTLNPAAGTSQATQCSNNPLWEGLPVGDYTITETTTPVNYVAISPIVFVVRNDCSGESGLCAQIGSSTLNLGTYENKLANTNWCSPGFWKTAIQFNRFNVWGMLGINSSATYSTIPISLNPAPLKKGNPSIVTFAQVLASPQTYGGPAFNSVSDYFAYLLGWGGNQITGENCPLNAHGQLTQ